MKLFLYFTKVKNIEFIVLSEKSSSRYFIEQITQYEKLNLILKIYKWRNLHKIIISIKLFLIIKVAEF